MIDFKELKARTDISAVAEMLDLSMTVHGAQMRGPCPACGGTNRRALVITPAKTAFFCFAARSGGDLISLAAHVHGCGVREAAEWIAQQLGEPSTVPVTRTVQVPPTASQARTPEPTGATLEPLAYLEEDHELVQTLFELQDAQALGVGYAPRGIMAKRVCVPLRLPDGRLVGYLGIGAGADVKLPKTLYVEPKVVAFKRKAS